jgi:hypothetical protein
VLAQNKLTDFLSNDGGEPPAPPLSKTLPNTVYAQKHGLVKPRWSIAVDPLLTSKN